MHQRKLYGFYPLYGDFLSFLITFPMLKFRLKGSPCKIQLRNRVLGMSAAIHALIDCSEPFFDQV